MKVIGETAAVMEAGKDAPTSPLSFRTLLCLARAFSSPLLRVSLPLLLSLSEPHLLAMSTNIPPCYSDNLPQ